MVQGGEHSGLLEKTHLSMNIIFIKEKHIDLTHKEYEDFIPGQELAHAIALSNAKRNHSFTLDKPDMSKLMLPMNIFVLGILSFHFR